MRIVVAEDLYLLRDGLVRLLEAHGHVIVAAVEDGPAALSAMVELRPDVAILDVRMPPTQRDEGLRAALEARRRVPALPVLILSQHVEQLYARELLADERGAVGYLLKDKVFDAAPFLSAVERVAEGGIVLDPEVVAKMMRSAPATPLDALAPREREILELMAEGLSNHAISQRLFLSEGAISKYTTTIFAKLGIAADVQANRRVQAVLAFIRESGS